MVIPFPWHYVYLGPILRSPSWCSGIDFHTSLGMLELGTMQISSATANGITFIHSDLDLSSSWGTEGPVRPLSSVVGAGHGGREICGSGAKA